MSNLDAENYIDDDVEIIEVEEEESNLFTKLLTPVNIVLLTLIFIVFIAIIVCLICL